MSFSDLYAKYNCNYCQEEINGIRVRCAECIDFDICLQCFSLGAEIGSHKNDHSYQFMDSGAFGIFLGRSSWSANEEVRLLDAIEQFGFGNWEDIAKHIETRSPEEAKDEYITRYLEGSIGRATWGNVESTSRPSLHCADRDEGPLGPSAVSRLPSLAVSSDESAQLGYMPNRDDFEREHDHEAEQLISTLSLNPEDDELDVGKFKNMFSLHTYQDFSLHNQHFLFCNQLLKLVFMKHCCGILRQLCRVVLGLIPYNDCIRQGSSGCLDTNQTKEAMQTSSQQLRKRDGESASSSTSPRCIRDGSTGCGCCRRSSCSSASGCSKHLLNTNEIQLCTSLSLAPAQFVTMKGVLLRRAPAPDCDLDLALAHYLRHAGWIPN
ncbi:transcriptional adapter 2B [Hyposmocoma kahamanoa]|uniref:transcriptional adapter 2B n=1 Tax=Hyposmocoma kahamanoa TaxID=1477025 RepID=UPI000E6D6CE0|nr:transcriptional adapter 2B [Hyposmocoma kahamanoa]